MDDKMTSERRAEISRLLRRCRGRMDLRKNFRSQSPSKGELGQIATELLDEVERQDALIGWLVGTQPGYLDSLKTKNANIHNLKCWPEYFKAVKERFKTWEVRKNDRGYKVGDILQLAEWDPTTEQYTGRIFSVRVTYMVELPQSPGFVGMTVVPE
ncbi:Uncharacterised protein [uncultured archaeon]|nr:Uncharacterised protein [uncultured archaeon]